eukprot:gene14561-17209_t
MAYAHVWTNSPVTYDDGDTEWLSLEKEQYEWLPARGSAPKGDSDGGSESEQSMDAEEMVDSDAESSPPAKKKQKHVSDITGTPVLSQATGGKPVVKVVNPPVALPKSVEKLTLPGAGSPAAAACAELTGGLGLALTDEAQRFQDGGASARMTEVPSARMTEVPSARMTEDDGGAFCQDDGGAFCQDDGASARMTEDDGASARMTELLPGWRSLGQDDGGAFCQDDGAFARMKEDDGGAFCQDGGGAFCQDDGGAQEQWWRFKADHFDAVIFFKMGKFYELFEMDAHVELLMPREGLSEETAAAIHSSFQGTLQRRLDAGTQMWEAERTMHELREGGYFGAQGDAFPELLTELEGAGVETPDMLAARKAKDSKCKDKVVRREKVAGLSLGTLTDYDMLAA